MPTVKINEKQYRFEHIEREPMGKGYERALKVKTAVQMEDYEQYCIDNNLNIEFIKRVKH